MSCFQDSLEGGVTINASLGCKAKSLMKGYPLSFLREGIHSKEQTNKQCHKKTSFLNFLKIEQKFEAFAQTKRMQNSRGTQMVYISN